MKKIEPRYVLRLGASLMVFSWAFLLSLGISATQIDSLAMIDQLELPEPSELNSEYPAPKDSNIATFQRILHDEFARFVVRNGDKIDVELLGRYLDLRDAWLESESLTKLILSGSITYATDRLLIQIALEASGVDSSEFAGLNRIAIRNELAPERLLKLFDDAIDTGSDTRQSFAELCGEKSTITPGDLCWVAYTKQFGLSYKSRAMGSINIVFLDCPLGPLKNGLAKAGILDDIGVNFVFLLHANRPELFLQYLARLIDTTRTRQVLWGAVSANREEPTYEERIAEIGNRLSAFAPAGKRWLAIESYALGDERTNAILLVQGVNPGVRELDFATPVTEKSVSHYRTIMSLLIDEANQR